MGEVPSRDGRAKQVVTPSVGSVRVRLGVRKTRLGFLGVRQTMAGTVEQSAECGRVGQARRRGEMSVGRKVRVVSDASMEEGASIAEGRIARCMALVGMPWMRELSVGG